MARPIMAVPREWEAFNCPLPRQFFLGDWAMGNR